MDRGRRITSTIGVFDELGCRSMLVTKPVNVRWLTGFTGSSGQVLISGNRELVLLTDGRYREQASDELSDAGVDAELVITREPDEVIADRLDAGPLGIESHHLTVDELRSLTRAIEERRGTVMLEVGPVIDRLRQEKDSGEVARLKSAAAIADAALARHEREILEGGLSERALARSLETAMYDLGADDLSFDTIVASGGNSARPHARPSSKIIQQGELVVIDFGASLDGYGSDMTRTFVCGGHPSDEQRSLHDSVLRAQELGRRTVRAGVEQRAVDDACRAALTADGHGEAFVHGTGHGIGLEIHEQPMLSQRSVGILAAHLVVTVEPGVYLPGTGGVRIEDSVVVTDDGCEPITHFPKGLVPWPLSPRTT